MTICLNNILYYIIKPFNFLFVILFKIFPIVFGPLDVGIAFGGKYAYN